MRQSPGKILSILAFALYAFSGDGGVGRLAQAAEQKDKSANERPTLNLSNRPAQVDPQKRSATLESETASRVTDNSSQSKERPAGAALDDPSGASTGAASGSSVTLDYEVYTRESIVEMGGKKFRKIEYKSKTVYLQLLAHEGTASDLQVMCYEGAGPQMPQQIRASVRVTKRTSFFVEGLRQMCQDIAGGKRIVIDPSIYAGFLFRDEPNATLKNKRIYFNPFFPTAVGFGAEW